ncbi:hypothetical protein [Massilia sp. 9I]|uniref:hypothetical protein n=1 Tax=Massilia sp. 9I TaxID=2653152 RepID=UPI0012F19B6F|nr:hypothetical protein [Massilia sp. 9I]VXA96545.1 conserved hypothetical protein [Massilia sp. 9I]
MRPIFAIVYQSGYPTEAFREFSDALRRENLTIHLEERQPLGPMAGVMWMMITGAFVYIGKSYFDGFLKEIGKEHYQLLKARLAELTTKTMDIPRIEPVLVGTAGKVEEDDPYTMAFSIYVEMRDGSQIKLLLPKNDGSIDYSQRTGVFLDFVKRCYEDGDAVLNEAGIQPSKRPGINPITVAFNSKSGKIEFQDPRPKHLRDK